MLPVFIIQATGVNLIKLCCSKLTCSFCKLDHSRELSRNVYIYKMAQLSKQCEEIYSKEVLRDCVQV